jgi:hypothetical protein
MDKKPVTLIEWLGLPDWPNMAKGRVWGVVLGTALVALFLVALIAMVVVIFGTIRDVLGEEGAGPNLGAGGLIAALLGAPFLIWSTVIKHRALGFQKEGHLTDRISAAVEQLGAEKIVKKDDKETTVPNIEVRIGGILSLERIAQDSTAYDKARDHVRVMEILCAYIRHNAPASEAKKSPVFFGEETSHSDALEKKTDNFAAAFEFGRTISGPRADIQMALRVIGRRSPRQRRIELETAYYGPEGYKLDLSHASLQKADLEGYIFDRASFYKSHLECAYLNRASLKGANLVLGQFFGAAANSVDFSGAKMDKCDLSCALLDRSTFVDCDFSHTDFIGSQLIGAKLEFKAQKKPNTIEVNRAFIVNCRLKDALISGHLSSAVNFAFNVNQFTWPNGIAFRNCAIPSHICSEQMLATTFGDSSVRVPSNFVRPSHWVASSLSDSDFHREWEKWKADPAAYVPPLTPDPHD